MKAVCVTCGQIIRLDKRHHSRYKRNYACSISCFLDAEEKYGYDGKLKSFLVEESGKDEV